MGQYYKIINVDKKEIMRPWDFDNGAKLMEWSYNGNTMVNALYNLLMDEWKGDRVYVCGDYADTSDMDECWAQTYAQIYTEIEPDYFVRLRENDMEEDDPKYRSVYSMADTWTHLFPDNKRLNTNETAARYIYNHETEQYIDLEHCPIEWVWYDHENDEARCSSVCPLTLLLAMGNDRGGGDYHEPHNSYDKVGTWVATSASIDVEPELLPACQHYKEFRPDFTENNPIVPYTELDAKLIAFLQDNKGL